MAEIIGSKMERENPYPKGDGTPSICLPNGDILVAGKNIPNYTGRPEALRAHKDFLRRLCIEDCYEDSDPRRLK